jgi:hypothetical protein
MDSSVFERSPAAGGALDRYTITFSGVRRPFTLTVPLIVPANADPDKYISNKKINDEMKIENLRN